MPTQVNLDTATTVWRQGSPVVVDGGHRALYRRLVHFAAGKAEPGTVTLDDGAGGAATGNGTIQDLDGGVDAPAETWTISFTSATAFDVSGSVSGAQPSGTVGENYTTTGDPRTSLISFRINQGGTNFAAGDTFSFSTSAPPLSGTADQWVLDRWSPFTSAGDGFAAIDDRAATGTTGALIWHGTGDGTEAIHAGITLVEDSGNQVWNFVMRGYTGFASSQDWDNNLDASPTAHTAFWDDDMTYWFVVNARRIVFVAVVSTTMRSGYVGLILPFASPQEWPFPMGVFGEANGSFAHTSTGSSIHHTIYRAGPSDFGAWIRDQSGTWIGNDRNPGFLQWPATTSSDLDNSNSWWENHQNFPNGDNQLFSIVYVRDTDGARPLGVPEGCFVITGFNVTPQTVLSISGTDFLVINDVFRTDRTAFWALRLV